MIQIEYYYSTNMNPWVFSICLFNTFYTKVLNVQSSHQHSNIQNFRFFCFHHQSNCLLWSISQIDLQNYLHLKNKQDVFQISVNNIDVKQFHCSQEDQMVVPLFLKSQIRRTNEMCSFLSLYWRACIFIFLKMLCNRQMLVLCIFVAYLAIILFKVWKQIYWPPIISFLKYFHTNCCVPHNIF